MNVYVKRAERRKKMNNVVSTTIVKSMLQTAFLAKLDLVISQYQKQGCEVEIQYSKDNVNFTALVLGRK